MKPSYQEPWRQTRKERESQRAKYSSDSWKDPDAGKDWVQEEKGTTEDEMVGWHHQLDGHGFGWTPGVGDGQGGRACCNSWGRKESDTTEWLNWTELIVDFKCSVIFRHTSKWFRLSIYLPIYRERRRERKNMCVCVFFLIFFPIMVYYRILNIYLPVLYRRALFIYFIYRS